VFQIPLHSLYPSLLCKDSIDSPEYVCAQPTACSAFSYRVDEEASITFHNWVTAHDMVCSPRYEIGFLGLF